LISTPFLSLFFCQCMIQLLDLTKNSAFRGSLNIKKILTKSVIYVRMQKIQTIICGIDRGRFRLSEKTVRSKIK
jgi:hypothetical protein